MKTNPKWLFLLLAVPILGGVGYFLWAKPLGRSSEAKKPKVSFYQDSMHPWVKSDQPGKCTICAMDLTAIYEGQKGLEVGGNMVVLSSNNITVLNVQAAEVKRQVLRSTLRMAGTLEVNETRKTIVSAPAPCRIQSMMVEYTGMAVEKGQPLISVFSPELVGKAAYFRGTTSNPQDSPNSATFPKAKSDVFARELIAPQSGVVVERNAYAGQYVTEGEKLLTIVDASVLWFRFDVYDRQLPWLEIGQKMGVVVPAIPGKVFPAVIVFIEPALNELTRTVRVRADVANPLIGGTNGHPHRLLRFGMYAEGRVQAEVPEVLTVPRTAILFPGGTAYAYVVKGDGAYERRRVKLGRQGDELWEILSGLDEGDLVVTAGNVLMDAQAQFQQGGEFQDEAMQDMSSTEPAVAQESNAAGMDHMAAAGGGAMPAPDNEAKAPLSAGSEEMSPAAALAPSAMHRMGTNSMTAAATPENSLPEATSDLTNRTVTHGAAYSSARMAFKEEQWRNRMALIAAAHERGDTNGGARTANLSAVVSVMAPLQATNAALLSLNQRQALESFIAKASGISQALAADKLDQLNQEVARLPEVVQPLQKELGAPHRWQGLIEGLVASSGAAAPAKNLAEAHKWFLPFSTAVVELAKQLKKQDPAFARLKIYHCPMAPKPGLWLQAKGPLANPFYGAEMLTCGKEVTE